MAAPPGQGFGLRRITIVADRPSPRRGRGFIRCHGPARNAMTMCVTTDGSNAAIDSQPSTARYIFGKGGGSSVPQKGSWQESQTSSNWLPCS